MSRHECVGSKGLSHIRGGDGRGSPHPATPHPHPKPTYTTIDAYNVVFFIHRRDVTVNLQTAHANGRRVLQSMLYQKKSLCFMLTQLSLASYVG